MSIDLQSSGFPALLPRSVYAQPVIGTLMPAPPVTSHLWQEYHNDAPTLIYSGPNVEDRRVVENPTLVNLVRTLQPKQRLHLCFLERAVATIEANIALATFFLRWWIEDRFGNVVREHPTYDQAAYNANSASAQLVNGRHGWMWDGRNGAANPPFVPAEEYFSRIEVKDLGGAVVQTDRQPIQVEGDPYRIWIVGEPKSNGDMQREFARADAPLNGRFLNAAGERIARDCWIFVQRGQQNDGHIVYLGQGTIEATKVEAGDNAGAVATPHGREYKGWIRRDPRGSDARPDRVQIEDVGRTDGLITLPNPGGPAANNPYSSSGTAVKDGVQAHAGAAWTTTGLSIGCTTASAIDASPMAPGSVRGAVRSVDSSFGDWGNGTAAQNVTVRGPAFVNKQTKRNRTDDALIADGHAAPHLDPPQHPAPVAGHPDEPLHMQPTMQQGVFGGFQGHEIPRAGTVVDEPSNRLRIRMTLANYAAGTLYYLYHHAVVFGHAWEQNGAGYRLTAWIPNKVIRGWNGNFRNILIRGRCQVAWYIERRQNFHLDGTPGVPVNTIVHGLEPAGVAGNYAALPNGAIGRPQRNWNPALPLPAGVYVSVFKYKVELKPFRADTHVWVAEPAMVDSFPAPVGVAATGGARLAAETLVTNGNRQFIEGRSELSIVTVP